MKSVLNRLRHPPSNTDMGIISEPRFQIPAVLNDEANAISFEGGLPGFLRRGEFVRRG